MLSIEKKNINALFDELSKTGKVFIPQQTKGEMADYHLYQEGSVLAEGLNTQRSAKDFFFPQVENMYDIKYDGPHIDVIDRREEMDDFFVFGVRACDAASFRILDRVYLEEPYIDTFYKNRRDHGIIFTNACFRPDSTCFCTVYGIDAVNEPGGDVATWEADGRFWFEANTEKGREVLSKLTCLEEGTPEELEEKKAKAEKIFDRLPFGKLDLSVFKDKGLLDIFNMPIWKELSASCLGCGTCTFVCPTCQCFDIRDFDTGHGIRRYRTWDSCMYSDFTQMAAANPRHTQTERFRQRFMHKMVYYPDKYDGVYSCVGCGRCLRQCPISMNIVKVIKKVTEEAHAE